MVFIGRSSLKSLDAFKEALKEHPSIKRFQELETFLNNDSKLQTLILNMKDIQKEYVHAKTFQQKDNEVFLSEKLIQIQKQVDQYPLLSEYLELQHQINDMLQDFVHIFEDELEKELQMLNNMESNHP